MSRVKITMTVWMLAIVCGLLSTWRPAVAEEALAKLDESLFLGQPILADNVTVWPIYTTKQVEKVSEYQTLTSAQAKTLAEVSEVGAQTANADGVQARGGAQVNQVVIANTSDKPILVLAGTLVKGGQQDRLIAQDFIIPPGKTIPVDAFCVEHGRWTDNREGKNTGGKFAAQEVQAVQKVRDSGQMLKSQGDVWANVATANAVAGKAPSSGTLMATMETDSKEDLERRAKLCQAITEGLAALAKGEQAPIGFAYAIDGKVRAARVFNHPAIFQHYCKQLVNTVSVEGDLAQRHARADKKEIYKDTADVKQVVEMVQNAESLKKEQTDTNAGNFNEYRKSPKFNAAKAYEKDADGKPAATPATQYWTRDE